MKNVLGEITWRSSYIVMERLDRLAAHLGSGVAPPTYGARLGRPVKELAGHIGLVQGDATHFFTAPQSFDRAHRATQQATIVQQDLQRSVKGRFAGLRRSRDFWAANFWTAALAGTET